MNGKSKKWIFPVVIGILVIIAAVCVSVFIAKRNKVSEIEDSYPKRELSEEEVSQIEYEEFYSEVAELPIAYDDSASDYAGEGKEDCYVETDDNSGNEDAVQTTYDTEGIEDIVDINSVEDLNNYKTIAAELSTDDWAKATDFEWFLGYLRAGGFEAGAPVWNSGDVQQIDIDKYELLNGGWKAYIYSNNGSMLERYLNAVIDTDGSKFDITMNYKYFVMDGNTAEEHDSDTFVGAWDGVDKTAEAQSDYAQVIFNRFYILGDNSMELAVGRFYWISGEIEDIALMRRKLK